MQTGAGKGKEMKRILTVQDISCLGKCSITIALPVISALGVECVILPTAVLSNHTLFKSFTVKDLADQIVPISEQWKSEGVEFDAIYTGYLGTVEQIDMMKDLFKTFGSGDDKLVFVDPVMADNGKLYPAFDMEYARRNTELCSHADMIVPNITEACIMTGTEYREEYDEAYIKDLLSKVVNLGARVSVLTGVSLSEGKTGVGDGTTLNSAIQKACGDNKGRFTLAIMHSVVATGYENLHLLAYMKYTDSTGMERDLAIGTLNGRIVLVDDSMPVIAGQNDDPDKYITYVLGDGAIEYTDCGAKVPYEVDRDPKTNGGQDTLYARQRKSFAPYGISFTKASMAKESPTDAELETGTNWQLVSGGTGNKKQYIDHKAIPIARIISLG